MFQTHVIDFILRNTQNKKSSAGGPLPVPSPNVPTHRSWPQFSRRPPSLRELMQKSNYWTINLRASSSYSEGRFVSSWKSHPNVFVILFVWSVFWHWVETFYFYTLKNQVSSKEFIVFESLCIKSKRRSCLCWKKAPKMAREGALFPIKIKEEPRLSGTRHSR